MDTFVYCAAERVRCGVYAWGDDGNPSNNELPIVVPISSLGGSVKAACCKLEWPLSRYRPCGCFPYPRA
jgi:hypothetical protein